jgi:hypothetical protein
MAEKTPQTFGNHVRQHPPFHFFLIPAALVLLILTIVNVVRHSNELSAWILLLIGVMMPVAVLMIRTNPLRVQDRLIRLEEQLRLASILPDPLRPQIGELTVQQLIALRFASDQEVPGLVQKALQARLPPREIKKAIVNWRADLFRV